MRIPERGRIGNIQSHFSHRVNPKKPTDVYNGEKLIKLQIREKLTYKETKQSRVYSGNMFNSLKNYWKLLAMDKEKNSSSRLNNRIE